MISVLLPLAMVFPASLRDEASNGWQPLATGSWSKPVTDTRGFALRGRLLLLQKAVNPDRRETAVFLELQDVSQSVGSTMLLFCDLGRTDFRPEYKPGLHCQLYDESHKSVSASGFPFGGAVPGSQWIVLPSQATIRLRCSPFGIHQPGAITLCPDAFHFWTIPDNDKKTYYFSGTFTIDPPSNPPALGGEQVWKGTIELPAVRIINKSESVPSK